MFDSPVLTQSILDDCWKRAPIYDRENRFFQEDFDELKAAGYLRLAEMVLDLDERPRWG